MVQSWSSMICKNDLTLPFGGLFSCNPLLFPVALMCLFCRKDSLVSLQSVIVLNIWIAWTSAWDHAPLTRPLVHFHHKPSCGPAQQKLRHRTRYSTWLESHETRESDVGSNETMNNLCFCCLHLLCLDFLEVCASKLTNEAKIT